jgi:hypothetical protein
MSIVPVCRVQSCFVRRRPFGAFHLLDTAVSVGYHPRLCDFAPSGQIIRPIVVLLIDSSVNQSTSE